MDTKLQRTDEIIIDAYLRKAYELRQKRQIDVDDVCRAARVSRTTFYRHFRGGLPEVLSRARADIYDDVVATLKERNRTRDGYTLTTISISILPVLYKYRERLKILYNGFADPQAMRALELSVVGWIAPLYRSDEVEEYVEFFVARVLIALVATWVTEEIVIPPEIFQREFLKLSETSLAQLLR